MTYLMHYIGGDGGTPFNFNGLGNGATLKQIWVWVGGSQLTAIKAWLTDGRSMEFGIPSGNPQQFVFEDGEFFTSLSLWDNGYGTRAGSFKFRTNKSREFFVQMPEVLKTEYPIGIGSGICMGISGRSGAEIDGLSFIFINNIESTVMKDVKYPTLHTEIPKVLVEKIKSITYHNTSDVQQEYKVETSKAITKKSSWSTTNKMELSLNMEVSSGIPEVMEISSGFGFTLGTERTYDLENSEEKTELLSFPVNVPPKKSMDVNITIGGVTFDLPYTGTVQITCSNGSTLEYPTKGIYKGVTYTDVTILVKESKKKPELRIFS